MLAPAAAGLAQATEARLQDADGTHITTWYIPAKQGQPTLIHFHGNAGNIANRVPYYKALSEAGLGVLAVEYRGYGTSEGSPTEQGFYEDGRTAVKYLTQQQHVPLEHIMFYGESIGTGVAVQMAKEFNAGGVILQSPYTSMASIGASRYPWMPVGLLLTDRFDSINKISSVKIPALILHGDEDTVIPFKEGQTLFDHANQPKDFVLFPGRGHNDLDITARVKAVQQFVLKHHH